MKPFALTFLVLFYAVCVSATEVPKSTLRGMSFGQAVKFEYRDFGCFGEWRKCVGSIFRTKRGWQLKSQITVSAQAPMVTVEALLSEEEIVAWDAAFRPKHYGDDDMIMSGGFSLSITWPDGVSQTLSGTGDDDRLAQQLWKHADKKGPNQALERNADIRHARCCAPVAPAAVVAHL